MLARPLDGIRVLDVSLGPVTGLATMILGDFGAEVVKVEPPAGDPYRELANAPLWLRGKRSIELDLRSEAGRAEVARLAESADVLATTFRPEEAVSRGCDAERLSTRNPGLVYCRVTGFGSHGPYAAYPGYPGIVDAKAGRMQVFSTIADRQGPGYAALPVSMHAATQGAVAGIVAALFERETSGLGQVVETSLLQGLLPYDLVSLLRTQLTRRDAERFPDMPASGAALPTLNYHPLPAKDGRWLQMGNLLQHLFDNFLAATGLDDIYADPRYQAPIAEWASDAREEFRDRMLLHMKTRTSDEWMGAFVANGGVAATAYHSTQEAMHDPDLLANGYVVEQEHPEFGTTRQLGLLGQFCETPGQPGSPSHAAGADNAEAGHLWTGGPVARGAGRRQAPGGPLAGVTILEFATIIAAPLGVAMLGDLGARIIKVEPIGGDPFRTMAPFGTMTVKTNVSKESIGIDMKHPESRAILEKLLRGADAVIHNYRPGVPERLGIGYEQCRAVKADIVHVSVNGYGPHGPGAHRPSTHPIPGAACGGASQQSAAAYLWDGETAEELRRTAVRLFKSNESNPDPNTSVVVASATMLALFARRRLGSGQQVFVDMMGANAYANAGDFISYTGKKELTWPDVDLHGLSATYRLYRAQEGWVFLALPSDAEFARFCEMAGTQELATRPEFASAEGRGRNGTELAGALASVLEARSAGAWEELMAPNGIGCVRADGPGPGEFWSDDAHVRENNFVVPSDHARFGRHLRWGALATLSRTPCTTRAGALGGDHTVAIMTEIGYTPAEVERLYEAKVIWSEPTDPLD